MPQERDIQQYEQYLNDTYSPESAPERIAAGVESVVYCVSGERSLICKFNAPNSLALQNRYLNLLNQKGIPAPEVVSFDQTSEFDFLAMEEVQGLTLTQIYPTLDSVQKGKLSENIGGFMSQIHQIDTIHQTPTRGALMKVLNQAVDEMQGQSTGFSLGAEYEETIKILEARIGKGDSSRKLSHGDPSKHNFIVGKENMDILALLDPLNWHPFDPALDVGLFEFFCQRDNLSLDLVLMLGAYNSDNPNKVDINQVRVIMLPYLFSKISYYQHIKHPSLEFTVSRLKESVQELKHNG